MELHMGHAADGILFLTRFSSTKGLGKPAQRHSVSYEDESWRVVLEWSGVKFSSGKSRMECSCDVCY